MKKILLIATVLLAAMQVTAASVDVATARATAMRYLQSETRYGRHAAPVTAADVELVLAEPSSANVRQTVYYIFNTSDSYVIVSGDDRARQVLAHGDSPFDIDNIPCNMRVWLENYKGQIEYLQAHPDMVVNDEGPRRESALGYQSVSPLLTTMWDQGDPYNRECPLSGDQHCYTGCGATSLSMIFHFWKYPTEPTPTIAAYTTQSEHFTLAALPPTTFDWDNMRDHYFGNYSSVQADAVAHLMRYVGQSERMDYTTSGSGTGTYDILQTVRRFGYDQDVQVVSKEDWWSGETYDDEEWGAFIQEELMCGRPILMCAYSQTWSGHAFNIDGYDATEDTYHINWGWSGSGNAFYALNAFKGGGEVFNVGQQLIIGIEPPVTVPTIKTFSSRVAATAYVDSTATKTFAVKGTLLTSDVTLTLEDESGFFSIDTDQIGVDLLHRMQPVNVSYSPTAVGEHIATVTLSSEGAEDKVITLIGTCLLETYSPVMLDASDVTASSFNVQWNDATPTHNVVSYNLEAVRLPFSELRLQETFDKTEFSGTSSSDCSSKLDEITWTPGWTGSKLYRSNNNILLGASKSKGWIETPSLDMYGNNDLVTVKVIAKSTGEDSSSPLKITCGNNDTTIYVSSDVAEYSLLLPCPNSDKVKVRLSSVAGKRIMLCQFDAFAGDDYSPVDLTKANYFNGITDMSYTLENLTSGYYGVRVQALYTDNTLSSWSNRIKAFIDWKRGDVNHDGEINIADVNELIDVIFKSITSASAHAINDVNEDREINLADINMLVDLIMDSQENR